MNNPAAGAGFAVTNGKATGLSSLHTHDTSGVVHIESPTKTPYTLGQFFTEWGVAIGPGRLGGLVNGHGEALKVSVNGSAFAGNPAGIIFEPHQEIVLWFGPAATNRRCPRATTSPPGSRCRRS